MGRLRLFLIHLGVSAALAGALILLFVFLWFPLPYFATDGGWQALRLIASVDVVVGPLLTLLVANPKKSHRALARDLAIIGAIQLAALALGLFAVFGQRTDAVVLADGTFYPLEAAETARLGSAFQGIAASAKGRPLYLVADFPDEPEKRQKLRAAALATGRPLYRDEEYFAPLGEASRAEVEATAQPPRKLVANTPEARAAVDAFLSSLGGAPEDHLLFPVLGRYEKFLLALSRRDLKVEGWLRGVQLRGWESGDSKSKPR